MTDIIVAADQLKSIVQRVERLEAEISDLNADKSEVYKEARANGFDVKAIKKVVSKRKLDENEREEQDAVFDTYWDAVHGSGLVHAHARENIEKFPASGGASPAVANPMAALGTEESAASNFQQEESDAGHAGSSYAEMKGRKVADIHPDLARHVADGLGGRRQG